MASTKSAKKRIRQDTKRTVKNKSQKTALRTQVKKFLKVEQEGKVEIADETLRLTVKKIDKGVAKGLLHKKTANRRKSRLAKKLNKLKVSSGK
ncbi:MAG: 30S ribosomal protein S20 [Candidatus Brocadiaceae bacterium]|nr:30S ribosomal protein S20 [Candidatus Brocadiaceae bacterium]